MQSYLVKTLTNVSCAVALIAAYTPNLMFAKASAAKPKIDTKQVSAQFNTMVEKYLMDHPDVIIKAVHKYQADMEAKRKQENTDFMRKNAKSLFAEKVNGLLGSAKASTNILLYTDMQCGYCQQAVKNLEKLISANSNIKLSIKHLPILGEPSVLAAKAAMLAEDQGKFVAANNALMAIQKPMTKEKIIDSLKSIGISKDSLEKAWKSEKYELAIKDNYRDAQKLGIQGTPFIAIANKSYSKVDYVNEFIDEKQLAKTVNNF